LFEYAKSFIEYITKFSHIKKEQERVFLTSFCLSFYSYLKEILIDNIEEEFENTENFTEKHANKIFNNIIKELEEIHKKIPNEIPFKINLEYINIFKDEIIEIIHLVLEIFPITDIQLKKLLLLLRNEIQKRIGGTNIFTGIVITGFGEEEIFPSIYSCNIHGKLGNQLIITNEQKEQISNDNSARIIPFAQSEMVSSFMEGIDPEFEFEIKKQIGWLINNIEGIIDKSYKDKLLVIQDNFFDYIGNFKRENYIFPIMNIVDSLQKTELAEMAESLVNLTSFKKQVSRESETVGGPIDVAVITKGDGFVWIKRKHYFDIKYNKQFFTNYFQEDNNE
jgi:hypothetical protein